MSEPKVLITGGTGFVGSHLVEALLAQGVTPHATTASSENTYIHTLLPEDHIHTIDLTQPAEVSELLTTLLPTQVYHLAALAAVGSSFEQMESIFENNLRLQLVLLEHLKKHIPEARVLIVGSGLEYDPYVVNQTEHNTLSETSPLGPVSPYAVSKVFQDLLALSYHYSYNLQVVRARPFNHIGERQSPDFAISAFAKQIVAIERGEQTEIKVGDLSSTRDISDVKDIVRAYILLMQEGKVGEVYNLGSGRGHTMQQLLDQLIELSQATVKVTVDQSRIRPNDPKYLVADISKIKALGWSCEIPIKESLERVIQYWRAQ